MKKIKILAYLPHHIKNYGIGYAAHSLSLGMNSKYVVSDIFSIRSDLASQSEHVLQAFPRQIIYRLATKFFKHKHLISITEQRFIKKMRNYDIAYLWPGCSNKTVQTLKKQGKIIIFENINCHQRYAKAILDREARRLNLSDFHHITEISINNEDVNLQLADYVFSPSPEVTRSLLENHVEPNKIIESSYGLDEHEILPNKKVSEDKPFLNALFVGSVIPRKGVQLLLDYWDASNVNACLTIIGKVEESLKFLIDRYTGHPRIKFVEFTSDLETYYADADIFIMPSLEEGSPLVSYLALGAGLPAIVSPMAGEGVYTDTQEGFIIDPYDKEMWIKAIQTMVNDSAMRLQMSRSAKKRAESFIWEKVAQRRIDELSIRLQRG